MRKHYPECKVHPYSLEPGSTPMQLDGEDPPPYGNNDNTIYSKIAPERKRELMIEAAGKGNNRAIWMIAAGYQTGWWGFPIDKQQAMKWYRILSDSWQIDANRGDREALEVLKILDNYRNRKQKTR